MLLVDKDVFLLFTAIIDYKDPLVQDQPASDKLILQD